MQTAEIKVLKFEELDDSAKERAREWWRQLEAQEFDTEFLVDDFQAVAEILGIQFDQRAVPLMNGSTRNEPKIWWRGFWSQGDGASFEGCYYYAKGAAKRIREYAPKDETLHGIADALQEAQRRAFYQLSAKIEHGPSMYYHEMTMRISVEHETREPTEAEEDAITEAMRDFARWIYKSLETEYDWRMADEQVDESIIANEYEFTEDGERY